MKSYKYILLDWDGNLAMTLDIWHAALKAPLQSRGYKFTDEQIGANFTNFHERMSRLGVRDVNDIIAEADEISTREVPDVKLYPDAVFTLKSLRNAGKKLALVTTSRHDQIDCLLQKYYLTDIFDIVICGDDVQQHKPHPEAIEKALRLLCASKEEAIMVGDSHSDIVGASNAGVDSVLFFPRGHEKFYDIHKLKALRPTHIIEDFKEVIRLAHS